MKGMRLTTDAVKKLTDTIAGIATVESPDGEVVSLRDLWTRVPPTWRVTLNETISGSPVIVHTVYLQAPSRHVAVRTAPDVLEKRLARSARGPGFFVAAGPTEVKIDDDGQIIVDDGKG